MSQTDRDGHIRCAYCGTRLSAEDPDNEEYTGDTHYVAKCREYLFSAHKQLKLELSAIRCGATK